MAWKSPGSNAKMQNDKGWRMKRKIVKEWVNVVQLGNYSTLLYKNLALGDVAAKASVL